MNNIDKTKKELATPNESTIQNRCNHIGVYLGTNGMHSWDNTISYCLLCGKKLSWNEMMELDSLFVYGHNYLNDKYNTDFELECIQKFNMIQSLAIAIIKDNPKINNIKLINKLNQQII